MNEQSKATTKLAGIWRGLRRITLGYRWPSAGEQHPSFFKQLAPANHFRQGPTL